MCLTRRWILKQKKINIITIVECVNDWFSKKMQLTETRYKKISYPVLFDENEELVTTVSGYLKCLAESGRGYSQNTINLYARQLKYFCEYLKLNLQYKKSNLDHVLASISGNVIDQYMAFLRNSGLQNNTLRNRDVILMGFFKWMTTSESGNLRKKSGYENGLKSPGGKRKMPRYVTYDLVIKLLNNMNHESQRCIVHFMYDSGLRVSEVSRITKQDIDSLDLWGEELDYLPLLVKGSKGRGGDNIKERYVLISRAVYSRIKRYHSTPAYRFAMNGKAKPAFLNTDRGAIQTKAIQKMVEDARKRANLPERSVSPHKLRHGTALSLLRGEAGNDYLEKLVIIQKQFGHASVSSTEQYTHIPPTLFAKSQNNGEIKKRFEEAQEIYELTYQPFKNHKENRGRPRGNSQRR